MHLLFQKSLIFFQAWTCSRKIENCVTSFHYMFVINNLWNTLILYGWKVWPQSGIYCNLIGPLDQSSELNFKGKNVPRCFGKVRRKSNVCIIQYDWLIALYLFIPLVCIASFLIVKNSGVREELSDLPFFLWHNFKNHFERTYFWWVRNRDPHLWLVHIPNWHFSLNLPFFLCPFLSAIPSTSAPFSR